MVESEIVVQPVKEKLHLKLWIVIFDFDFGHCREDR